MPNPTPEEIAGKLSKAQRVYLHAVATADGPYEPRHGNTANWALRHGYVDAIVRLDDGRVGPWRSFGQDPVGISSLLGQRLTPFGQCVRDILKEQSK